MAFIEEVNNMGLDASDSPFESVSEIDWKLFQEQVRQNPTLFGAIDALISVLGFEGLLEYHNFLAEKCEGMFKYVVPASATKIGTFFLWNSCRWSENGTKVSGCHDENLVVDGVVSIQGIQNQLVHTLRQRSEDITDIGDLIIATFGQGAEPEELQVRRRMIRATASNVWGLGEKIVTGGGVMTLAAVGTRAGFATTGLDFDSNPWSMNFANGVLDFKTMTMEDNESSNPDLHTRVTSCRYLKDKDYSDWNAFVKDRLSGNQELADYLQEFIGVSLIGYCYDSLTLFINGEGGTGKNTTLEPIVEAFGEYGWQAPTSLLVANKGAGPDEDAVDLQGRRLIWLDEGVTNAVLKSDRFKSWTGQDRGGYISASRKHAHNIRFRICFNFIWSLEIMPKIQDIKEGEKRRIRRLVFDNKILVTDGAVKSKLQTCDMREQIMAWAIAGLQRVLDRNPQKLEEPKKIQAWSGEYFDREDLFKQYALERLIPVEATATTLAKNGVSLKLVAADYRQWLRENGHDPNFGRSNSQWVKDRLVYDLKTTVKKARGTDYYTLGGIDGGIRKLYNGESPKDSVSDRVIGMRFVESSDTSVADTLLSWEPEHNG